ncbi:MAG TPA: hypothetical protein VFG04_11615, partial [Planctomycetaceae bacterium]|nr:hypothetical protein [Planctomycetaceae bacterium]
KLFDESTPATVDKERIPGTADFLSPEQARDGQAIDGRSDIYSLGCTFYFLLAGHPPFPNGTLAQRPASHIGKAPTSITEIRGDVSADLALILSRMMAKTPGDRYQTAEEVSEVLREWLVSHADSKWLRQHPAVLSPLSIPQEATARSSKGSNVPPAVSAAASGAVRTGSPPTSSRHRPATIGTGVTEAHLIDQQDSSAIDALIARRRRTPWVMRLRRSLSLEVIALGLTSLVAVLGGLAWYASREKEPPAPVDLKAAKQTALPEPQTAPAPPRRRIDGDIRVGPRGHFKTIAQAIDFVRDSYANDMLFPTSKAESRTIKVAGWHSIYSEKIDIDNKDFHFPKGLRIICDDPVPAILSPPDNQSVVRLHGVERFTLEGFEIDATNQRPAIELSGYLVGTQLRNLKIQGDCETSILIQGAMGLERPASRCILDHLVLRRQRAGGTGVRFEKAADASSNLSIRGCRFFGPFDSAIAFGGPVSGIDVRESIITQASVGIRVEPAGLTFKDLAIVNNTFHKLDRAIVFRDTPPGAIIDLIVQRNLFTSVAVAEMFVEKGSDRGALLARFAKGAITGNWTSRKVGEPLPDGEINLFSGGQTGAALQFQTNDPADDHFLWPVDHAPHKALGAVILK